ncbi:hypothetical protein Ddc_10698 [Ditylenchus destructor]|nr:hypothetical protein Ddc_10698 [Ditylenchus destructor]
MQLKLPLLSLSSSHLPIITKVKSKNIDVNSVNNTPLDIKRTLRLIRKGNIKEAESLIISSTFGPFYESDPDLVFALKLQEFVEIHKNRDDNDLEDGLKMLDLGRFLTKLSLETPKLNEKLRRKLQVRVLTFYTKNQTPEEYAYLLKNEARSNLAILIECAFKPKAIKTEDTDGISRKSIENVETAEQILNLISEGEIIRAEKLILSSVYGSLYEGDQELILAMKTQAFIELLKERKKDDAEQCSAVSELGTLIADLESEMQDLTPKIKLKVQRALLLYHCTNLWSSEHAYLLKEDERTKVADLIKAIFEAYEASKKCIFDVLKKAKEA